MNWDRESLLRYLDDKGIVYREVQHAPVFTMAESALLNLNLPGTRCKNLLVQDKKGSARFLVVTPPDAAVDLGALGRALNVGRLSLCPAEDMQSLLGVSPGSLSPLALVADASGEVRLLIDESLRTAAIFLFHPLESGATVSIESGEFSRYLRGTGHRPEYVEVPRRMSN